MGFDNGLDDGQTQPGAAFFIAAATRRSLYKKRPEGSEPSGRFVL